MLAAAALMAAPSAVTHLPSTGARDADVGLGAFVALVGIAFFSWILIQGEPSMRPAVFVLLAGLAGGFVATAVGWAGGQVAAKVAAATAGGALLGRQVLAAWWLLLFAGVVVAVDVWSVFLGPTRVLVTEGREVLSYLLIPLPALGGPVAAGGVGMSDLVFVALFTTGAARTGLRPRASFSAMVASLAAALVLALLVGRPLPALPFVGVSFVLVNVDRFLFRRQ